MFTIIDLIPKLDTTVSSTYDYFIENFGTMGKKIKTECFKTKKLRKEGSHVAYRVYTKTQTADTPNNLVIPTISSVNFTSTSMDMSHTNENFLDYIQNLPFSSFWRLNRLLSISLSINVKYSGLHIANDYVNVKFYITKMEREPISPYFSFSKSPTINKISYLGNCIECIIPKTITNHILYGEYVINLIIALLGGSSEKFSINSSNLTSKEVNSIFDYNLYGSDPNLIIVLENDVDVHFFGPAKIESMELEHNQI